jgi:hypothetical protein
VLLHSTSYCFNSCHFQDGDIAVVQLLLAFGADVNQVDSDNQTPLDVAAKGLTKNRVHAKKIHWVTSPIATPPPMSPLLCRSPPKFDVGINEADSSACELLQTCQDDSQGVTKFTKNKDDMRDKLARILKILKSVSVNSRSIHEQSCESHSSGDGNVETAAIDENKAMDMNHNASAAKVGSQDYLDGRAVPMRERSYSQNMSYATFKDMEDGNTLSTLYERLQQCVNMSLDSSGIADIYYSASFVEQLGLVPKHHWSILGLIF